MEALLVPVEFRDKDIFREPDNDSSGKAEDFGAHL